MTDHSQPSDTLIHDLLDHHGWVVRLARALSRDDADADDLAQDTWVQAMRRPPADDGATRSWLGTVMRNLARNRARSDERRDRRERAAGRGAVGEDTSQLVARAEAHGRAVDAVVALDEPYRATVLMHYFQGASLREVAERTGVTREAAKKRLQRAHAMLRSALDEEHGGDRRAWLLPLLGGDGQRTTPWGSVAFVGAAVALVAAAAILAGTLWSPPDPYSPDVVSDGSEAAAAHPPVDVGAVVDAAGDDLKLTTDAGRLGEELGAAVEGPPDQIATGVRVGRLRVEDATGNPLPGALLTAYSVIDDPAWRWRGADANLWALREIPAPTATATTDADGTAQLPLPAAATTVVVARLAGRAEATVSLRPYRARSGEFDAVLTLGQAHSLRGRVLDERGAGRSGLSIHAMPRHAVGGATAVHARRVVPVASGGWFEIEDLPAGDWAVCVQGPNMLHAQVAIVRLPDPEPLTIELPRGCTLSGTITDALTGAPLVGVAVDVWTQMDSGPGTRARVRTGADGRYRYETLTSGSLGKLEVSLHGFVRGDPVGFGSGGVPLPSGGEVIQDVALHRGGTVRGHVTTGDRPAPSAFVVAQFARNRLSGSFVARVGADGTYELTSLPAGKPTLTARIDDPVHGERALEPTSGTRPIQIQPGAEPLEIDFVDRKGTPPTLVLYGRVIDEAGEPIEHARVGHVRRVLTAADGTFTMRVPRREGGVRLVIQHADHGSVRTQVPLEDRPEQSVGDVVLPPPALVRGRLLDPSGEPVPDADVWYGESRPGLSEMVWFTPESGVAWSTRSGADGRYELHLRHVPGTFRIRARAKGRALSESGDFQHSGARETPTVDLVLRPGASIHGTVVDARTGEPIAGVGLGLLSHALYGRGNDNAARWIRSGSLPVVARSRADGSFRIDGLDPGEFEVGVIKAGFANVDVAVIAPRVDPIEVRLEPLFDIAGIVLRADGAPLAGLRVRAANRNSGPYDSAEAITSERGEFRLRGLVFGEYRIRVAGSKGGPDGVAAGTEGVRVVVEEAARPDAE